MARLVVGGKYCRCRSKRCGKRFKGHPGLSACPACGRVGRLDKWAQSRPWRVKTCRCDAIYTTTAVAAAAVSVRAPGPICLDCPGCRSEGVSNA